MRSGRTCGSSCSAGSGPRPPCGTWRQQSRRRCARTPARPTQGHPARRPPWGVAAQTALLVHPVRRQSAPPSPGMPPALPGRPSRMWLMLLRSSKCKGVAQISLASPQEVLTAARARLTTGRNSRGHLPFKLSVLWAKFAIMTWCIDFDMPPPRYSYPG